MWLINIVCLCTSIRCIVPQKIYLKFIKALSKLYKKFLEQDERKREREGGEKIMPFQSVSSIDMTTANNVLMVH